jgi:hypothetical protein
MVVKKTSELVTSETFTTKTVAELVVGDRFRSSPDDVWQQVVSFEKSESGLLEADYFTKKEIVTCETKIEGSAEKFRFVSFAKVSVEVLDT